ncbi:MAG: DUF719 domain-containing protein [Phycisphaerales bacterium]|nr:DUF719 domain-containing protein [Phycisphaerales bacterium]
MKNYSLVWVALWALLCGGASPSVADLDNPGGSIDRIEKDIEQIQQLIATNKSRLESYQEQVKELTEAHQKAEEKAAETQRECNQVKEEFNAARAKAVEAQVQCEDTRKKVLQKQQEEPEFKQLKTLLDLTQRDWEAQQARVLLALSEQAEYQGLQTLLGDARLRADPEAQRIEFRTAFNRCQYPGNTGVTDRPHGKGRAGKRQRGCRSSKETRRTQIPYGNSQ